MITYPLETPSTELVGLTLRAVEAIGFVEAPTSFRSNTQDFGGQRWEADIELSPAMMRGGELEPEEWVALLLALRGRRGTFLAGDPAGATPRGGWAGTPVVNGAHAAGASAVALDGLTAGTTVKRGDYIQFGSGLLTHLHKVTQDGTASGAGEITIDIWPFLRASLADNDAIVTTGAKGHWRLASNTRQWSIRHARLYGISFAAIEAL